MAKGPATLTISFVAACLFAAATVPVSAQSYPTKSITVVVPFPAGGPSDVVARIVTDHMGRDAGPPAGDRECRRRRWHARERARRRRLAGRLHPAGRQHGVARRSAGAHAQPQIRSLEGLRADRLHRAFAGGDRRRARIFPAKDLAEFVAYVKTERRQGEAGAWRHRRLLAHGVPAVHLRARPQADAWSPIAAPARR